MTDALLHALLFQGGYNAALVSLGAALLGLAAGAVGAFTTLRRRALTSDAMAHATLPGIGLAFLVMAAAGRRWAQSHRPADRGGPLGRTWPVLAATPYRPDPPHRRRRHRGHPVQLLWHGHRDPDGDPEPLARTPRRTGRLPSWLHRRDADVGRPADRRGRRGDPCPARDPAPRPCDDGLRSQPCPDDGRQYAGRRYGAFAADAGLRAAWACAS